MGHRQVAELARESVELGPAQGVAIGLEEQRGVIDVFAVKESRQHQGIGSAIIANLLARVKKLGVRRMETMVRWNNWQLLQFLEYVGFRPSTRLNLERRLSS